MTPEQRLAELRELFLTAPAPVEVRVLWLVKRRTLREEYTPIWLLVAFAIALVSLVSPLLQALTRAIGAWTQSSALFFFGQLFLVAICLNYAVRLSQLTLQVKNLVQEVAVLRAEIEDATRRAPSAPQLPS
jgi:predicted PurR-regulated permease PerM